MKIGTTINDRLIKVTKSFIKNEIYQLTNIRGWRELEKTVFKIVNIRKYQNSYPQNSFFYEVDVIVDMKEVDGYFYSNSYCEKNKRRVNRYYKGIISYDVINELKYFGFDNSTDSLEVKKVTYKEIV
jgi:hypothetical protein